MKSLTRFREIKPEIRILGIDDFPFNPHRHGRTTLIGVVFRGGLWLDGAMRTEVEVDGRDSTDKIVEMVRSSVHYKQLRVIMTDSVTVAGFNVIDLKQLNDETRLPVIAITREMPDEEEVKAALKNLPDWEDRWRVIENAGTLREVRVKRTVLYAHVVGASFEDAEEIIRISSTRANFPEPLRAAHLLAQGLGGRTSDTDKRDKLISL